MRLAPVNRSKSEENRVRVRFRDRQKGVFYMKKLSVLLALLLVLTCVALAACGREDETSSDASSETSGVSSVSSGAESSAPSESSSASETASSAVSSETSSATSSETSSEASSDTSSAPVAQTAESTEGVEPSGTSLASGLKLTGADPVDTALGNYPGNLTDGVFLAEGGTFTFSADWLGYWYNVKDAAVESKTNAPGGVAAPIVDLGKATEIHAARIHVMLGNTSGIVAPSEIKFSYSEDGTNWVDFGVKTFEKPAENDKTFDWVGFTLAEPATAQYVRVSLKCTDTWTFVDELEVY